MLPAVISDVGPVQQLWAKGIDIVANAISGMLVVAAALGAWKLRDRSVRRQERLALRELRRSQIAILRAELTTLVSFAEQCEISSAALEQFTSYKQWLISNNLMSWRSNRLIVKSWQQTGGSAIQIRLGQVAISKAIVDELAADMRKTELPGEADEDFRWGLATRHRKAQEREDERPE